VKDWLLNLSIAKKLMAGFMFIGLGSFSVIAALALTSFISNHQQQLLQQLSILADAKVQQIQQVPTAQAAELQQLLALPQSMHPATSLQLISSEQLAEHQSQWPLEANTSINDDTWLAHSPLTIAGKNYVLVASLASDIATAPIKQIQLYTAILAVLGIIFNLVFAWSVATSFSRPILALSKTFKRITAEGNFSLRSPSMRRTDEIRVMGQAIDQHLHQLQQSIDEANGVVDHIAHGHFEQRIKAPYQGDLDQLKQGINASASSVASTMQALDEVMQAIAQGNFSYRLQGVAMEGEFHQTLNQTMSTMQAAIGEISQVMEAAALGDFSQRVAMPLDGDMARLKNSINSSINAINEALTETADFAQSMAFGNLTKRIEGAFDGRLEDLKTALNSSVENMENTVGAVLLASNSVAENSAEISRGTEQLSTRTQAQTNSLEATANSMVSIANTITATAQQAEEAQTLVTATHNSADEGSELMEEAIRAMQAIDASSQKIAAIVNFIDGIAFQTNLLALNASIEAARAGEHGHGFAVVAGEVRVLAQNSAASAKDIKELVEDSVIKVGQGQQVINQVSDSFNAINASVVQVHDLVGQIDAATGEQKATVEQINHAVKALEGLNQQNVALVEESSASSYSLSEQTQNLKQQISFFKVDNKHSLDTPVAAPIAAKKATSVPAEPEIVAPVFAAIAPIEAFKNLHEAGHNEEQWNDF